MTVQTQAPQQETDPLNIPTQDNKITDWDSLPVLDNLVEILPMCSRMLADHPDREQVLTALVAFVNQFSAWQSILLGSTAEAEDLENILMSESVVLDLTNDWYRRSKPMLEPVLMECKSCLTMVRILEAIGEADDSRLEEEMDLVWSQFVRMWDFIPWFIFMGTGDVSMYTSIRMLMVRYCTAAKPDFVKRYKAMRSG